MQYRAVRFGGHSVNQGGSRAAVLHLRASRSRLGREVVNGLHRQPGTGGAFTRLLQPCGEVPAHASMAVKHSAERRSRDPQPCRSVADRQPEGGHEILREDLAGVHGARHHHVFDTAQV